MIADATLNYRHLIPHPCVLFPEDPRRHNPNHSGECVADGCHPKTNRRLLISFCSSSVSVAAAASPFKMPLPIAIAKLYTARLSPNLSAPNDRLTIAVHDDITVPSASPTPTAENILDDDEVLSLPASAAMDTENRAPPNERNTDLGALNESSTTSDAHPAPSLQKRSLERMPQPCSRVPFLTRQHVSEGTRLVHPKQGRANGTSDDHENNPIQRSAGYTS